MPVNEASVVNVKGSIFFGDPKTWASKSFFNSVHALMHSVYHSILFDFLKLNPPDSFRHAIFLRSPLKMKSSHPELVFFQIRTISFEMIWSATFKTILAIHSCLIPLTATLTIFFPKTYAVFDC